MPEVIGISNPNIRAVEGAEIPTFRVSGVFGEGLTGAQLSEFADHGHTKAGETRFILDSVGGDLHDAFHFYDYVRANGLKVHVDGYGRVASAATVMMAAAGRKRARLAPNALFLVHNATGGDPEFLTDANRRMVDIYMSLTGQGRREIQALMKEDKPINAAKAVEMGFAGSVIELQRLAAHHKENEMEKETVQDKRTFKITTAQAIKAIKTGTVELSFDIDKEVADVVATLTTEAKEAATKLTEVQDEVKARDEAIVAAGEKITAAELKAKEEGAKVTALTTERDALKAELETLKKTPITPAVKAQGEKVVDPGAKAEGQPRFTKASPEERHQAIVSQMHEMTQSTSK